ncbi:OmpA family protein [Jannaschia sp. S6380]|uniref:OmpA family protein n=1 Tax=Jannaschia sp. S6380 TaxID=2926408 RepID=UPI001FF44ADD|nr:OmpA family protein [Jannaschia sp. S6380]MCK0167156.1 OmpA family protein [Jannaschia sp. S6380]
MPRTPRNLTMPRNPVRQATALVASLSLLVPGAPLMAQEGEAIADEILATCTAEFEGDAEALANCVAERTEAAVEEIEQDMVEGGAVEGDAEGVVDIDGEGAVDGGDAVEGGEAVDDAEAVEPEIAEEVVEESADAEDAQPVEVEAVEGEVAEDAEAAEAEAEVLTEDAPETAEETAEDTAPEAAPDADVQEVTEESIAEQLEADAAEAEAEAEADAEAEVEAEAEAEEAVDEVIDEAQDTGEPVDGTGEELATQGTEDGAEALQDEVATEEDTATEEGAEETDAGEMATEETAAEEAAAEEATSEEAATEDAASEEAAQDATAEETETDTPQAEVTPLVETPTESEIAEEVAAQPEPELTEEQEVARDQASRALESLTDPNEGTAAAAASDDAEAAEVEEQVIAEEDVRTSDQDFTTQAVVTDRDDDDDDGLSRNQKIALGALGALAVGTVLANRNRVVSNSGDRVVVQRDDGGLQVLKDDDALLRQSGNEVRTERFDDGSTRTTVIRPDGSRIVTIRDASLRVLRRKLVETDGTEYTLIDDTAAVEPVDVATLPAPIVSSRSDGGDDALRAALNREAGLDRRFSLAQVRNISQVRALAPAFEVDTVTFASGSAAISPEQAGNLTGLAREVLAAIRENPREVFLIEGHTDAVGDAAYNLALSDRRAETLALALNEYFGVPVENMVVQGYGEQFLKVPTQTDERANRRATVRQITGLLQTAAAN